MLRSRARPGLLLVVMAGCAGEPVPVSRSAHDPSNPDAAEVPFLLPGAEPAPSVPIVDAGAPPLHHHLPGTPGAP